MVETNSCIKAGALNEMIPECAIFLAELAAISTGDSNANLRLDGFLSLYANSLFLDPQMTQEELLSQTKSWLQEYQTNGKPLVQKDWLGFFLRVEKEFGHWPDETDLAAQLFNNRLAEVRARVAKLGAGDIEGFRQILIASDLRIYRRDYNKLSGVLLDWGGNCVSQTLLMLGLLREYPHILGENQLGFALYDDHVEAVVMDSRQVIFLVSGIVQNIPLAVTVFQPEAMLFHYFNSICRASRNKVSGCNISLTAHRLYAILESKI